MALLNVSKLISLLITRHSISFSEIQELCGVSRRTVYRYINALSEANFPVYYDRSVKGYRLNKTFGLTFDRLSPEEFIYICIALKQLYRKVNKLYAEEIDGLIQKLLTMQKMPLVDLWETINSDIDNRNSDGDTSTLISSAIMRYAILFKRDLNIKLIDGEDGDKTVKIENPVIHFKKHWQLSSSKSKDNRIIPISKIDKVKTLRVKK